MSDPKNDNDTKRSKKREKIMQSALKVFSRKGYSPAALDEVAREASIAKGTLYLYFQDKEDLFSGTILYVMDKLAERMQKNISDTMDPIETMKTLAYEELDFFAKNSEFFGLIHTVMSGNLLGNHRSLLKTINERRFELIEYLKRLITEAKKTGQIKSDIETVDIVYAFIGMIESSIDQMHFIDGTCTAHDRSQSDIKMDIGRKVDTILCILLDGVRTDRRRN
ncbi:MAG: TetR/AcrR family transcriptional regulator [Spirochaetes bacterium]|nr:TetR/AcrR family transcriptional regulator [Spirochaetota bacterium]